MRSILFRSALTFGLLAFAVIVGAVVNDLLRNQPGAFGPPAFVAVLAAGIRPIWLPWNAGDGRRWRAFAVAALAGAIVVALAGVLIGALARSTITSTTAAMLGALSAVAASVLAWLLSMFALDQLPPAVRLERSQWEALRLYTTDDLRRLYQAEPESRPARELIRLRADNIPLQQIRNVILWRVWWERFSYHLLLAVTVVGAFAAIVAAVEGWKE